MDIVDMDAGGQIHLVVTRDELALISNSVLNALEFVPRREYHTFAGFDPEEAELFLSTLLPLEAKHGLRKTFDLDQSPKTPQQPDRMTPHE